MRRIATARATEIATGRPSGMALTASPTDAPAGRYDVLSTVMHEMGHAFQGWESQAIEAVDLQWPTSDAAEVHSMGMEYQAALLAGRAVAKNQAAQPATRSWL